MDTFPISFRYERRLKNRNQLGPSNLPELSGFFAYACDPVMIRVVCYTLNGSLPSRYANSIAVRLRSRRLRPDPSKTLSDTFPPFSLQKRWRSPLANPITKRLVSRLAQDTAVAGPLKGRSATNSFSPEATDQTTTLESSPSHLSAKASDQIERKDRTDAYQTTILLADGEVIHWPCMALKSILKIELYSSRRRHCGHDLLCQKEKNKLILKTSNPVLYCCRH